MFRNFRQLRVQVFAAYGSALHACLIGALVALGLAGCAHQTDTGPLIVASQGSFFVGGRDVQSDTLSALPAYAPAAPITVDQMYVRYQIPVDADRPSDHADPWLLPDRQNLGDDAGRPHGLGRVFRAQGPRST